MATDIPQAWIDRVKAYAQEDGVYSADNQGKWQGKAGTHVPVVTKNADGTVTVKASRILLLF